MSKEKPILENALKDIIEQYNSDISELIRNNNSILLANQGLIEELKKDLNVLIDFDLNIAQAVLTETNTPKEEQNKILNYLSTIKKLLTLNKLHNTTYKVSEEQLKYVELFFNKVAELEEINKKLHLENLKKISKITNTTDTYKTLLNQLENENTPKYISDINLIKLLLSETYIENDTKRDILFEILRYNKEVAKTIV